ncbi:MAG: c-type cytochrome [Nitrospirota bacterium]
MLLQFRGLTISTIEKIALSVTLFIFIGFTYSVYASGPQDPADKDEEEDHSHVIEAKVPSDKLSEMRRLKNPVVANKKVLEEAKAIYTGKGTCFNCHGDKGKGDGPLAESFNPPPRDFYDKDDIGWQKIRTDGEIFWVITNGAGAGMPPFADMLSDEERWSLVIYIREIGKSSATDLATKGKKKH